MTKYISDTMCKVQASERRHREEPQAFSCPFIYYWYYSLVLQAQEFMLWLFKESCFRQLDSKITNVLQEERLDASINIPLFIVPCQFYKLHTDMYKPLYNIFRNCAIMYNWRGRNQYNIKLIIKPVTTKQIL